MKEKELRALLPDELLREFKAVCALNGITAKDAIKELLKKAVADPGLIKARFELPVDIWDGIPDEYDKITMDKDFTFTAWNKKITPNISTDKASWAWNASGTEDHFYNLYNFKVIEAPFDPTPLNLDYEDCLWRRP